MKRLSKILRTKLLVLVSFFVLPAVAQKKHFIYFQSENKLPFQVQINHTTYQSSPAGFLIVPQLNNGIYQFLIESPDNQFKKHGFECEIAKKDLGYLLKKANDKDLVLINLVDNAVLTSNPQIVKAGASTILSVKNDEPEENLNTKINPPSVKLTTVVPTVDSSTLYNVTSSQTTRNAQTGTTIQKDTTSATAIIAVTNKEIEGPPSNKQESEQNTIMEVNPPSDSAYSISPISNKNKVQTNKSNQTIVQQNKIDSISPAATIQEFSQELKQSNDILNKTNVKVEETKPKEEPKATTPETIDAVRTNKQVAASKQADAKANKQSVFTLVRTLDEVDEVKYYYVDIINQPSDTLQISIPKIALQEVTNKKEEVSETGNQARVTISSISKEQYNTSCVNLAKEEDVLKLRKKMAEQPDDLSMVDVAAKIFREKCFTVEQVSRLSQLFISNRGKYEFFEMSSQFVYDRLKLKELESELSEATYKTKWRNIIQAYE